MKPSKERNSGKAAPAAPGAASGKTAAPSAGSGTRPGAPPLATAGATPPAATTSPGTTARPGTPPLDLSSLEERLKDTRAIGLFTKLSLKNQVDDLLSQFRAFHAKKVPPLSELRQRYDLLLLKVLSLLQDGDPPLATAISGSREALWGMLTDPQKFQKL